MLAGMRYQVPGVREVVLIDDDVVVEAAPSWTVTDYEHLLQSAVRGFEFEDFDENAGATTFYTTGTTGDPKRVCSSHRQLALHPLAILAAGGGSAHGQSFRRADVYMPMTPL